MAEFAGDAYHAFIREQLDEERSTKTSLEQRGVFVVTSAATLGTLLFGFATLVRKPEGLELPAPAQLFLQWGAALFVIAALCGLVVNWPRNYQEALPAEMEEIINSGEAWEAPLGEGYQVTSDTRTRILAAARAANRSKANFLVAAMSAEVLASLSVTVSLVQVLAAA